AFEYSFIKLIELKENSGSPAKPRNIGIEEANGKYIFFLDADDWISSKGLSHLLRYVEENNSDIGFGQSYRHTNNKVQKIARFSSYTEITNINTNKIKRVYRAIGTKVKIIKKSIIEDNGIRFKDLNLIPFSSIIDFLIIFPGGPSANYTLSILLGLIFGISAYEENLAIFCTLLFVCL